MVYNKEKAKVGREFVTKIKNLAINNGINIKPKNNSYFPDLDCIILKERVGIECKYLTDIRYVNGIVNYEKKKVKDRKIIILCYGNYKKGIYFIELFCPIEKREILRRILVLLNSLV